MAPVACSYIPFFQRKLKMLFDLLRQGDQLLVQFVNIRRGIFDQFVQMTKFEEPLRLYSQVLPQSRAVCFDANTLQRL